MFKKILAWFKKPKIEQKSTSPKTLRDVDFFDTIWVVDKNGDCYEGWVFDKTKKHIIATAYNKKGFNSDFRFIIKAEDMNKPYITQNHTTIYFDYKCWQEK